MHLGELDSLPAKVREGTLSKEQAAMKVLEILYVNPGRFNLHSMKEDDRSDFLIDMLPRFASLIERHNQNISPFGAYLFHSLPGLKLSWNKSRIQKYNIERAMKPAVKDIYEKTREKSVLAVAMPKSIEARKNAALEARHKIPFNSIFHSHNKSFLRNNSIHEKRSALILALKSAWLLDDSKIDEIVKFCGCKKESFEKKLEALKDMLVEKNERYNKLEERRSQAWYFVCKYREELQHLERGSRAYKSTKRKLEYQLHSWKTKNKVIQNGKRLQACNADIAKILEIDSHRISVYLKYAKEHFKEQESV